MIGAVRMLRVTFAGCRIVAMATLVALWSAASATIHGC